jgi:hypothetical protein
VDKGSGMIASQKFKTRGIWQSVVWIVAIMSLLSCAPASTSKTPGILNRTVEDSLNSYPPTPKYVVYKYVDPSGQPLQVRLLECFRIELNRFKTVECVFGWSELEIEEPSVPVDEVSPSNFLLTVDDGSEQKASEIYEYQNYFGLNWFVVRFDDVPFSYKSLKRIDFDTRIPGIIFDSVIFGVDPRRRP